MASDQMMSGSHIGIWDNRVPNQSPKLVVVSIIFFFVSTIVVIIRFAWRWAHLQRGLDDIMALCAYLVLLVMTIFGFLAADYGFGKPMQYVLPTLSRALEYFFLYQICYKLLGGFTKLTFCFLYLRIFSQKSFQTLVWIIIAITAAGSLAFAIGTVFQCTPIERAWNHSIPGTCTSNVAFWYSHAAFNTFMDLVIYIMPIPMIRTLQLARGQKTGLISIFCLGAFVIAASIVRMVALRSSALSSDHTWGSLDALTWTEIEGNTSVICCCMPALRVPLIGVWNRFSEKATSRVGSTPPRSDEKPDRFRDGAWAGPHKSTAFIQGGVLATPAKCYYSGTGSSKSRTMASSHVSKAETWYERALRSISKDTTVNRTTNSSQEDLTQAQWMEDATVLRTPGVPAVMELGAIYKTTDLHVSTSGPEDSASVRIDRNISLPNFLKEG